MKCLGNLRAMKWEKATRAPWSPGPDPQLAVGTVLKSLLSFQPEDTTFKKESAGKSVIQTAGKSGWAL